MRVVPEPGLVVYAEIEDNVLGVTVRTVQRRLNRSLLFPAEQLDDLRPK